MFSAFVLELSNIVEKAMCGYPISWIVCGADLNANFAGSGIPPRRSDDHAESRIRKFMKRFNLMSMAEEVKLNLNFSFRVRVFHFPVLMPVIHFMLN